MSIISQVSVILLILLTITIILYANKGLRLAQEEGEHFVDEWALKQARLEEQKRRIAREKAARRETSSGKSSEKKQGQRIQEQRMQGQTVQGQRVQGPGIQELRAQEETKNRGKKADNVIPIHSVGPARYRLTVKDEEKKTVGMVDVDHYPYTIGRDRSNDLVLDDIYVARRHCVILEERGQAVLKNQGSQNGIFTGGRQVEEYPLKKEGHFYIGTYEFIVSETGHRSQPTIRYGS